jgi:FAD synthase
MKAMTKVSASSGAGRKQPGASAGAQFSGAVRLEGIVEHGDARGRELGYPTANISVPDGEIGDGVWAGTVRLGPEGLGETYAAAVSVGRRPTYYRKGTRLLEAHLLDYSGDLYGRIVRVSLHVYIRPQRRFRGTDELAAQIRGDVACVRSWAAGAGHESWT